MTERATTRDTEPVAVRPAEDRDTADAVRLLDQLGYQRDRATVEHDLKVGAAGAIYVAVQPGHVVGLVAVSMHRQFHWGASVASIDALIVDRSIRSRGIGAALLDAAVAHARRGGCILIELHSNRRRRRAHQFYQRHGFEVTSSYFVKRLR